MNKVRRVFWDVYGYALLLDAAEFIEKKKAEQREIDEKIPIQHFLSN